MEGLHNPVKAIRMPSPPAGRDRRLQPGELEMLLEFSSEEMNQVIRFALETAMRRGEIVGMTWEIVDLKKRTVTLPETKNGQKRIVPPLFRCRGNPQGTPRNPTTRRESMEYWSGCDLTGLRQGMSENRNFRASFPRSPARGDQSAF